jgi:hypothetical protein
MLPVKLEERGQRACNRHDVVELQSGFACAAHPRHARCGIIAHASAAARAWLGWPPTPVESTALPPAGGSATGPSGAYAALATAGRTQASAHEPQYTPPQKRQWCRRVSQPKEAPQARSWQQVAAASGTHCASGFRASATNLTASCCTTGNTAFLCGDSSPTEPANMLLECPSPTSEIKPPAPPAFCAAPVTPNSRLIVPASCCGKSFSCCAGGVRSAARASPCSTTACSATVSSSSMPRPDRLSQALGGADARPDCCGAAVYSASWLQSCNSRKARSVGGVGPAAGPTMGPGAAPAVGLPQSGSTAPTCPSARSCMRTRTPGLALACRAACRPWPGGGFVPGPGLGNGPACRPACTCRALGFDVARSSAAVL